MMDKSRRYAFSWNYIGDIALGRPNLGFRTRVENYRLFQYALRDVLEQSYGTEEADSLLFRAGHLAGEQFYKHYIGPQTTFDAFIKAVQEKMESMNIGILRVESIDSEQKHVQLTVSEDLDCSGLPETGNVVCKYDEGFIAGLFKSFTGKEFSAREIDCWCTGDRTCRFDVQES